MIKINMHTLIKLIILIINKMNRKLKLNKVGSFKDKHLINYRKHPSFIDL